MEIRDFKHPKMVHINNISASYYEEDFEDLENVNRSNSLICQESDDNEVFNNYYKLGLQPTDDSKNLSSSINNINSLKSQKDKQNNYEKKTEISKGEDQNGEVIKVYEIDEDEYSYHSREASIIMFGGNTPSPHNSNKNESPIQLKKKKTQSNSENSRSLSPVLYKNYKHGKVENGNDEEELNQQLNVEQNEERPNVMPNSNRNFNEIEGVADNNEINEEIDNETNEPLEPIYVMTIELEKGKKDIVKIFANSSPEKLAFDFCKNNDLDHEAMIYLIDEIQALMNRYLYKISSENIEIIEAAQDEEVDSDRKRTVEENKEGRTGEGAVREEGKDWSNLENLERMKNEENNNELNEGERDSPYNKNIDAEMITEDADDQNDYGLPTENNIKSNRSSHIRATQGNHEHTNLSNAITDEYIKKNILSKAEESLFREKNSKQKLFSYELLEDTLSKSNIHSNANKSNFLHTTFNFNYKTEPEHSPISKKSKKLTHRENKDKAIIFEKLYQDAEKRRKKVKNNDKDFNLEIQTYNDRRCNNNFNNL